MGLINHFSFFKKQLAKYLQISLESLLEDIIIIIIIIIIKIIKALFILEISISTIQRWGAGLSKMSSK